MTESYGTAPPQGPRRDAPPSCRRLTIVIHSLEGGGAERIAAMMSRHWDRRGDKVTLITIDSIDKDSYPVGETVTRVGLDLLRPSRGVFQALRNNALRLRRLRKAIVRSRPDTVICLTDKTNVVTLMACARLTVPVIVYELVDPRYHEIGSVWSALRRWTYPRCHALVVQTAGVRDWFRNIVGSRPIHVIPTGLPVPPRSHHTLPDDMPPNPWVVAMGRLDDQKGFDLLLPAFARIAGRHPRWSLVILGEGPRRLLLETKVHDLGLRGRVDLRGWVDSPGDFLRAADLFVLSSRYEGFPNALIEAMACGLPAVSFDCPSGPSEIVRPGIDGLLVPPEDVAGLAAALDRLMSDGDLRGLMASRALEVRQRYSAEEFFARWERALPGQPGDRCVIRAPADTGLRE